VSQAAQRVGVWLLVLCIAGLAVAQVTQRTASRLHYHLPIADSEVLEVSAHDHDQDHEDGHGHTHRHLAEHEHSLADPSVRYVVDGKDSVAPTPPAPPPRLHDLDGLLISLPPEACPPDRERWPAERRPLIRSVVSAPLERPPRV
jgi:hypothetical protein